MKIREVSKGNYALVPSTLTPTDTHNVIRESWGSGKQYVETEDEMSTQAWPAGKRSKMG